MKRNKIDTFLILIAIMTLAFVVTMVWLFNRYQAVPDSLIAGFFGLVGGECGILGWIKSSNEKTRQRSYDLEDREYRDKKDAAALKQGGANTEHKEDPQDEAVG